MTDFTAQAERQLDLALQEQELADEAQREECWNAYDHHSAQAEWHWSEHNRLLQQAEEECV